MPLRPVCRPSDWQGRPLYLITDGYRLRTRGQLVSAVQAALEGASGAVSCVQLREQGLDTGANDSEILKLLAELKPICEAHSTKLMLSRRIDLVLRASVDGVHCGADSTPLRELRDQFGPQICLGYSAHSVAEAQTALCDGASYVLLSPIFPPKSKISDRSPLGVSAIRELRKCSDGVIIALGGIDQTNAACCRDAGADGVAVISAVFDQPDPADGARTVKMAWVNASGGRF